MSSSRGRAMSLLWRDDEELAKKDDDLGLPGHRKPTGFWQAARRPRRRVLARAAVYILAAVVFILVLRSATSASSDASAAHGPQGLYTSDDLRPPRDSRPQQPLPPNKPVPISPTKLDAKRPSKPDKDAAKTPETARDYAGKLRFPDLAASLQAISATGGASAKNRNVLFAAASLQSVSTLLPLACEMASERQNYVHFATMSRTAMSVKDILKTNGIDSTCPLIMHDARPDYTVKSTEYRMLVATTRALHHIHTYMHPQVLLVDSTNTEETYFLNGVREQVKAIHMELIELPDKPESRCSWLTKLDSTALAAWNKVHIDILVHAPVRGSGNLKRLLRSLAHADLGAVGYPSLTVELPNVVDIPARDFLAGFRWPPPSPYSPNPPNMLSLRHRITRERLTEEESSVRFLESFWPTQPSFSHVLVLSPNTEITPQFLSYAKYAILHHLYSSMASLETLKGRMMAISFQAPTTLLDASRPLIVPTDTSKSSEPSSGNPPFLWQAPASEAVLITGDKWVELHAYISRVLQQQGAGAVTPSLLAKKEVGKSYPAWLEYLLQLSRLRGYFTVYPGRETASAIVGVHSDLRDVPEEYENEVKTKTVTSGKDEEPTEQSEDAFDARSPIDVMVTLPHQGALPSIQDLPLLSWDGKKTTAEEMDKAAVEYTQAFRQDVGGCTAEEARLAKPERSAKELFCDAKNQG